MISDELTYRAWELSAEYLDGTRSADVGWAVIPGAWAMCRVDQRKIRIAWQLRAAPAYVLDAVLVHEVAHLIVGAGLPHHGAEHQALVARYPRSTMASAWLDSPARSHAKASGMAVPCEVR